MTATATSTATAELLNTLADRLQSDLGPLFHVSERGDAVSITTPFLYPDGTAITVYCQPRQDRLLISDQRRTSQWLRQQYQTDRWTAREIRIRRALCTNREITLQSEAIQSWCQWHAADLIPAIIRVAQACVELTAALWYASSRQQTERRNAAANPNHTFKPETP